MNKGVYNDTYKRSNTLEDIPVCRIMGVDIVAMQELEFLNNVLHNMVQLKGDYICATCVHSIVMAFEDVEYAKYQNSGYASVPDGGFLSSISKKRGYLDSERITGPDMMTYFFQHSQEHGLRHFFYGSTQDTLDKLKMNLKKKYPDLMIAGMYSPPFRSLTDIEDKQVVSIINKSNADVIWVGLGAPKQEKWMAEHQGKVNGLMLGVGAGFDYHAGNINRAPNWMQKIHMEWFYRVLKEPKRLAKRYFHSVPVLFWEGYVLGK